MTSLAGTIDQDRSVSEWARRIHALMPADLGEAARAVHRAALQYPGAVNLLALKAEVLAERGNLPGARKVLTVAIKCETIDAKSRRRLARVAIRMGRIETARHLILDGLAEAPDLEGLVPLLKNLIEIGQFGLAHGVLKTAHKRDPDPRLARLQVLAVEGMAWDRASGISPEGKRAWLKAMQLMLSRRPERAEASFAKAVRRWPFFAPAWIGLRGALEAQGRVEAAQGVGSDWLRAAPEAHGAIQAGMRRRLSPRGLMFDPREALRVRAKEDVLMRAPSADALKAMDNAYLVLDPGGETVAHRPASASKGRASSRCP